MKDAYVKFMLATVIYGTNGIIASHIPLSSYEIVLTRTVLGSLFLMVLTTFRHEWSTLHQMTPREWLLLVLAGVFLGGNWIFLYEAYQHIGVSLATLLCYIGPILIMILSRFVFKEPFTLPKVTAMILVTLGIMAINGADFKAHGLSWGVACGFLGAVCFALLIIVMKKAKPNDGFLFPGLSARRRLPPRRRRHLYYPDSGRRFNPPRPVLHGHIRHHQYGPRLCPLFYRRSTPVGPERFHLRLLRTLHGPPLVGLDSR